MLHATLEIEVNGLNSSSLHLPEPPKQMDKFTIIYSGKIFHRTRVSKLVLINMAHLQR